MPKSGISKVIRLNPYLRDVRNCTDPNDCLIALEELKKLSGVYGHLTTYRKKLAALENRKSKLL